MLQRYKEVYFGLLLGLGAWVIDVAMHAHMEGRSIWAELVRPDLATLLYRSLFVVFGLALGWSLWQNSKREREFRSLFEIVSRFHAEIVNPAFLIHTKVEVLLTRDDFRLPPEAVSVIRYVYEQSQKIVSAARERLPAQTEPTK